jgi:hypothetical protein
MIKRDLKGRFAEKFSDAVVQRREAELVLLEKLRREAAMPEWYPHQ